MPNRILKESICTSDSVDGLSWFEEVLFYRLIVNCDDYGRFDGRSPIIKNRLFPLKENITVKAVDNAVNRLASAGLVSLYEFEGKPYLYLPTWNEHQTVRAKRSRYPAPEDGIKTNASICKHMNADESICPRNPIQSNPNPNPNPKSCADAHDGFDDFWKSYPKKVGKDAARSAWKKAKDVPLETILDALDRQKKSAQWSKDGGQYIPNPATWLNQGRWQDELPANTEPPKGASGLGDAELEAIQRLMADEVIV